MKKGKKYIYGSLMAIIIIFSCVFVAFMGYMNFKTNYQEIKDTTYDEIAKEFVERIDTSIGFGKSLENYYGMADIFRACRKRLGKDMEVFVIDTKDAICYSTFEDRQQVYQEVEQGISQRGFQQAKQGESAKSIKTGGYNYLLNGIQDNGEIAGYYVIAYQDSMIENLLKEVKKTVIIQTFICTVLLLVLFLIGYVILLRLHLKEEKEEKVLHLYPAIIILLVLILQSGCSLYTFQQSYKESMLSGADEIMTNLHQSISSLVEQGIDLKDVEGVSEYLGEKVSQIPILWNVKISDEIANASGETQRESSLLKRYQLDENCLTLEAELSTEYIQDKLIQNILILVSTLIIMMIFILELMKLPALSLYLVSDRKNKECDESYLQVSNALRISGFLCGTAEYICVPYAAMLIREWNESVFGLSVGMTAALPLSLEGFTQMIAMLVLPKVIKKVDMRKALVIFGASMAIINVTAFFANSAMAIILFRGAAGIAYAGFKQISNYLITKGYHTELERSRNLSQDNAGLLAGVTCGAGLGAIICETAGYSATFIISAVVFLIYLFITLVVVPWRWLDNKQVSEENKERLGIKKVLKMLFSWEMFGYILLIGMPLNIGVQLCVTLVPAICQNQGISTAMLSYCYIVNGIAGIYIGPALVNVSKKRLGLCPSIAIAMALTGFALFIIKMPPVIVMLMIGSIIFGFLDGFATPLSMDEFMELSIVKRTVSESAALIMCVVISYMLMTVAPMIAEAMLVETNFILSPLTIGAIVYIVAAFFLIAKRKKKNG